MLKVLIAGAHSALAQALLEVIEERELPLELKKTTLAELVTGDLLIHGPEHVAWADVVVLCFFGRHAQDIAAEAVRAHKTVLDVAWATAADPAARHAFPELEPFARAPGLWLLPRGLSGPIIAAGRALAKLSPQRLFAATYESAAVLDQPGMDELSEQVRARFQLKEVEPRVFAGVLAFACLPRLSPAGVPAAEKDDELRRALEAGLLPHAADLEVYVTRVLVPTFSLDSAVVSFELAEAPEAEEVRAALAGARGLRCEPDEAASSAETLGRDDTLLSRLDVDGERVTMFLSVDHLRRGSATPCALALERWSA